MTDVLFPRSRLRRGPGSAGAEATRLCLRRRTGCADRNAGRPRCPGTKPTGRRALYRLLRRLVRNRPLYENGVGQQILVCQIYEYITYYEIEMARTTQFQQPGFVLHFIPIFYGMYADALD